MPKRKYKAEKQDYFVFSSAPSIYGMLRPIEETLRANGYQGLLLGDFDNSIFKASNEIDIKATQQAQLLANKEQGNNAPKVNPVIKQSKYHYVDLIDDADINQIGEMRPASGDSKYGMVEILTPESEKEFRNILKKYEKHIDLLIKNTPPDEYKEELSNLKFQKAYIRMINVFGSRAPIQDGHLGFMLNARGFDADIAVIKELGPKGSTGVDRDSWRSIQKNYPYSEDGEAMANLINLACDYEENKEKNSFVEQMKYREEYKKGLQNYLSSCKKIMNGKDEWEKLNKIQLRDDYINELIKKNQPNKGDMDILNKVEKEVKEGKEPNPEEKKIADKARQQLNQQTYEHYRELLKRAEDKQKAGQEPNPEESRIAKEVNEYIDKNFDPHANQPFNSRYGNELQGMGFYVNEEDFSGNRGNQLLFHEVEAQINAIDMGWPNDELIHIERLTKMFGELFDVKNKNLSVEDCEALKEAKDFYNTKIKDKPYPSTENERLELYQEFYEHSLKLTEVTKSTFYDKDDDEVELSLPRFSEDIKKSMDKPLSFAEKLVIRQTNEPQTEMSVEYLNKLKTDIGKSRFGHSDSSEYKNLKQAFEKFEKAYKADDQRFKETDQRKLSSEDIKLLEDLRASAGKYLKEKDKEKKLPEERSEMGKARYESALKAYQYANKVLKSREERLEKEVAVIKAAEQERGRKELREAYFNSNSLAGKTCIKYEMYKAGGKTEYRLQQERERAQAEADAKKEPVTDEEKYEHFINQCRTKKNDKVTIANEEKNKELQKNRINALGNMIAALEFREANKPFDSDAIQKRGAEIKELYALDQLKYSTDKLNGPEKLKNALSLTFKAESIKTELERGLYTVGKVNCKNILASQTNYQKDINELLSRKKPADLSDSSKRIIEALNDIKNVDMSDKTLCGLNTYKIRKANLKLMKAISDTFKENNKMDMDAYGPKLALDSLAVLSTYANCQTVTNKLLEKTAATVKDINGNKLNLNINDFILNYGVKRTKQIASEQKARNKSTLSVNVPAATQKITKQTEKVKRNPSI